MNLTKKQIEEIKKTKSVSELSDLVKESDYGLSDNDILGLYNTFHNSNKRISDAELTSTVGGSQMHAGSTYSDGIDFGDGEKKYLIVVPAFKSCDYHSCCVKCDHRKMSGVTSYCDRVWWEGGDNGHESTPERRGEKI